MAKSEGYVYHLEVYHKMMHILSAISLPRARMSANRVNDGNWAIKPVWFMSVSGILGYEVSVSQVRPEKFD